MKITREQAIEILVMSREEIEDNRICFSHGLDFTFIDVLNAVGISTEEINRAMDEAISKLVSMGDQLFYTDRLLGIKSPSIFLLLKALGVTEEEIKEAMK